MTNVDIWFRPWAFHSLEDRRADILAAGEIGVPAECRAAVWIVTDMAGGPLIDGKRSACEMIATLRDGRQVYAVPLPMKQAKGLVVETPIGKTLLRFAHLADAPNSGSRSQFGRAG